MSNYTKTREGSGSTDQPGIENVLRQSDKEMYALVKKVAGGEHEARHILEDVLYSMGRDEAYDVIENLEKEGFVGNDLSRAHRILNYNTTELIDSLSDDRKLSDIRKELRYESGADWSNSDDEYPY